MLIRPFGRIGGFNREVMPGDLLAGGESISAGAISTAGAGTWTGAAIATGIIRRTGPGAGYTDTTDTAENIIAALKGNNADLEVVPGSSFRLLVQNTVAFALTWAGGTGVVTGTGTLDIAASLVREYLVTVLNASVSEQRYCTTENGSADIDFVLPSGAASIPQDVNGSNGGSNITPGMGVSGTGISAGTYVIGVTQGLGGITGVKLSANATASGNANLSFTPRVRFDGLRTSTL